MPRPEKTLEPVMTDEEVWSWIDALTIVVGDRLRTDVPPENMMLDSNHAPTVLTLVPAVAAPDRVSGRIVGRGGGGMTMGGGSLGGRHSRLGRGRRLIAPFDRLIAYTPETNARLALRRKTFAPKKNDVLPTIDPRRIAGAKRRAGRGARAKREGRGADDR